MVTLRDIAKASGFSKTTVWLALDEHPRIPDKTRQQIREVAHEMGYAPNPAYKQMLKQVRAGRKINYRSTLGLIHGFDIPDPEDHYPYHHEIVRGVVARANELGYRIDKFWLNQPNLREERLSKILSSRGIQGVIISPFQSHIEMHLDWDNFAAISIGYTLTDPVLNRVEVNNQACMALCIRKCLQLGYRNIGLVMHPDHEISRRYELTSPYLWYMNSLDPEERAEVLVVDDENPKGFFDWYNQYRFSAIITTHTCVVDWLLARGINIPEDIGIVFPTPVYDYTEFDHVNQMPYLVGVAAADMAIAQLSRREFGCPDNSRIIRTNIAWQGGVSLRQVGPALDASIMDGVF